MKILSLFDGISCGQLALKRSGIKIDSYYASEIDPYAIQICKKNFPNTIHLGSVEDWETWNIDWDSIDMVIGGSPCQGFSLIGRQLAFDDDRSKLFFKFVDILEHIRKFNKNVKFLLENVKMKKEYVDTISTYLSTDPIIINSNLVSAQNRTRYYWCNWNVPQPDDKGITFRDIIKDPDLKAATVRKGSPRQIIFTGDKLHCLTASYYKGINADGRPALSNSVGAYNEIKVNGGCRMLTPTECELLQTIPEGYTSGVSNTQRYKMIGNGWTVDVISHIFTSMNINIPRGRLF